MGGVSEEELEELEELNELAKNEIITLSKGTEYEATDYTISPTELLKEFDCSKAEKAARIEILNSAIASANQIFKINAKQEKSKSRWRTACLVIFFVIFGASLGFIAVLLWRSAEGDMEISLEMLIAMFTYVITNIFSILYFMIKYIHNDKYLETFKIVTHKLLDYLIQDKDPNN